MVKEGTSEKGQKSVFERFGPGLLVITVLMAFAIGVLWEKVNNLEGGSVSTGKSSPTTAPAAGGAQAASKLTDLEALVKTAGVDINKYKSCYSGADAKARVEKQQSEGAAAGVQGTPAGFIINRAGDVWRIPGALSYDMIKPFLELALGKTSVAPTGVPITKLTSEEAAKLVKVNTNEHIRGDKNAKVYLVEYSDFECPFCIRFHPTTKQILENHKDVALVYRHFPLEQIHPNAKPAAIASECVAELGGNDAFWKFADAAFGQ